MCVWLWAPLHVNAQDPVTAPPAELAGLLTGTSACDGDNRDGSDGDHRATRVAEFVAGAAIGLGIHEGGHLVAGVLFDASPGVKRLRYAGIPFFAITHRAGLSPRQEFVVSAAGLWAEQAMSEVILSRRPHLRDERAPVAKGVLAFHLLSSLLYGVAAFAQTGPPERDTRSMAASRGIAEGWMGAVVLAPAVFDAWRYLRPGSRAARWGARVAKAGGVLLVISP